MPLAQHPQRLMSGLLRLILAPHIAPALAMALTLTLTLTLALALTPQGPDFIGGELSVAVLVQGLQRGGCPVDFSRSQSTVLVRVEDHEQHGVLTLGARTAPLSLTAPRAFLTASPKAAGTKFLSTELPVAILVELQQLTRGLFDFRRGEDAVCIRVQGGGDWRRKRLRPVAMRPARATAPPLLSANC